MVSQGHQPESFAALPGLAGDSAKSAPVSPEDEQAPAGAPDPTACLHHQYIGLKQLQCHLEVYLSFLIVQLNYEYGAMTLVFFEALYSAACFIDARPHNFSKNPQIV